MRLLLRHTFENIFNVAFCWWPGVSRRHIHSTVGNIMVALLAVLACQVLASYAAYQYLSASTLFTAGGNVLIYVAAAALGLLALRQGARVAELATGLLWALAIGTCLSYWASLNANTYEIWTYLIRSLLPFILPTCLFLLYRLGFVRGVATAMIMLLPAALYVGELTMAISRSNELANSVPTGPDTEMIYARQPDLIKAATAGLRASDPNKVELFAVLGAGYADQRVFRREVESIGFLLENSFDAQDRVVQLVNDRRDAASFPLMNRVNMNTALAAVGQSMGDEDIAMLFLTSHGGKERFSLSYYGVISRDLTPEDVNAGLDAAGIKNAILIVSACYSGSFVEKLSAPNRLVLTAAASDRSSFGCSDRNKWTDWGRAFFTKGLTENPDPRIAATLAQEQVAIWEKDRDLKPSLPQIAEGANIGPVLDAWLAGLTPDMPAEQALATHVVRQNLALAASALSPATE